MAEKSCDGAVAAALVPSGGRSSWAGVRLLFTEELEKIYFVRDSAFVMYYYSAIFFGSFHIGIVEFVIVGQ